MDLTSRTPSPVPVPGQASTRSDSVGFRDITTRLRFSRSARLCYATCVVLAAGLILVGSSTSSMGKWWYKALEGFLTLLFLLEILIKMYLQGIMPYLSQSKTNLVEALICCLCISIFMASLYEKDSTEEGVVEALLLSLRYLALLGRLCFFVRSSSSQTPTSRIEIRPYDNIHIQATASQEHLSGVWDDISASEDEQLRELLKREGTNPAANSQIE
eukprot:TRINITY_DN940_c3_g1_i2.p1 TRINITY_DN940_c3_g1~~TRINITY_DN940_c3_g1_i2.p1  ORF type:complete len:241 (+),score=41.27 TRINITY_DN940_c3_g1_i2:77-724(+)